MPAKVVIRDLRWEDWQDLVQNYYDCYEERAAHEPIGIHLFDARPPMAAEMSWFGSFYSRVQSGTTVSAIAEVDGRAAGLCTVSPRGGDTPSETSHVGDLGILLNRPARGRGIGELLMREVIARSRGRFRTITLSVFSNNERAKSLYRKLGFQKCGALPGAIRRGSQFLDLEEMFLPLVPSPAAEGAGSAQA